MGSSPPEWLPCNLNSCSLVSSCRLYMQELLLSVCLCDALAIMCAAACWCSTALPVCLPACLSAAFHVCLPACLSVCLSVCLPACLPACLPVPIKGLNCSALSNQVICVGYAGAYTAKRYSLWQSRQAVLNAQLTGPTGGSSNQLDTETAAADAIAALGRHTVHTHPIGFCTACLSFPAAPMLHQG